MVKITDEIRAANNFCFILPPEFDITIGRVKVQSEGVTRDGDFIKQTTGIRTFKEI